MKKGSLCLWGLHPVKAALANPRREAQELLGTAAALALFAGQRPDVPRRVISTPKALSEILPPQAVHQGVALRVEPLPDVFLEDLAEAPFVFALDHLSDPHNIGAILRSAAALGGGAVLTTHRQCPDETGFLAKAAAGALEVTPFCRVANLAEALRTLKKMGFWVWGLCERGEPLQPKALEGPSVFVLGAEGEGLRRLSAQTCDGLICLPTNPAFPTLNVSNAAAVIAYAWQGAQKA